MIYLELLQEIIAENSTISFSGANITSSTSLFDDFSVNDEIRILGTVNGNDKECKILSVSSSSITTDTTFTTEATLTDVTISKVGYFDTRGAYHNNSKGVNKFYSPYIISTSNVSWKKSGGLIKLDNGSVIVNRRAITNSIDDQTLTEFFPQEKTMQFKAIVKLDSNDYEIFNTPAIVKEVSITSVFFLLQTDVYSEDFLTPAPDINLTTFEDGRVYPKKYIVADPVTLDGLNHVDPLLINDVTYEYSNGIDNSIWGAYDDGVLVEFNSIITTYASGIYRKYGDYRYLSLVANPTKSPTGGTSDNSDWQYIDSAFESPFIASQSATHTFKLTNLPVGRVTAKGESNYSRSRDIMRNVADKIPLTKKISKNISFSGTRITETAGFFTDLIFNISTGQEQLQKLVITNSTSNNITTRITAYAVDGSYIDVEDTLATESAGAIVKIQFYYASLYRSDRQYIRAIFNNQKKALDILSDICYAIEEFCFIQNGVLYLNANEQYFLEVDGFSTDPIDQFSIDENAEVKLIIKDNIIAFEASKPVLTSIASPQSIIETEVFTVVETGQKTGRVEKIRQVGEFLSFLAINYKKGNYNNFNSLELSYTLDGVGIDTDLRVGRKIDFDCSYASGYILVREFTWDLKNGKNIISGLGQLTYK